MTTMKGLQFLRYVEIGVPVLVALKANYKLFLKGLIFNLADCMKIHGREELAKLL